VQTNAGASGRTPDPFAALITAKDLSTQVIVLSLLLALGLGALHAVSPGHGKTLMAAYLVGTRGTLGQAVLLGLTVTVTHTLGVLMLGLATLVAAQYILPDRLYPWLTVGSGLLVIGMGIALVADRWHALQHARPHTHDEAHRHRHGVFGREHSHLPTSLEPGLSWQSLIGLGAVGGLVPSASALLLLLGAISLQRIPFGIVLIIVFGLGMAFVLVGVGVLFVRASSLLGRYRVSGRWMAFVPFVSALFVIGAGIFMTVEALLQMGLFNP
jgi:ABC-type nickel/cobalt efflux system permease component RcnA